MSEDPWLASDMESTDILLSASARRIASLETSSDSLSFPRHNFSFSIQSFRAPQVRRICRETGKILFVGFAFPGCSGFAISSNNS